MELTNSLSSDVDGPGGSARTRGARGTHSSFVCTVCSKAYKSKPHLRRHVKQQPDEAHTELHKQLDSLECQRCKRAFSRREWITRHEKGCDKEPPAAPANPLSATGNYYHDGDDLQFAATSQLTPLSLFLAEATIDGTPNDVSNTRVRDIRGAEFCMNEEDKISQTLTADGALIICSISTIPIQMNFANKVNAFEQNGIMGYTTQEFVKRELFLNKASILHP